MEVTGKLLASGFDFAGSQRLYHYRAAVDHFEQVAGSRDVLGRAIAGRVALGSDLEDAVLLVDLKAANL